jgi:hypothetical protein
MHISMVVSYGNQVVLRKLGLAVLAFAVTFGLPSAGRAVTPPSVTLTPSVASPQMVGTTVIWTAAVNNAPAGHTYGYQFSVTFKGQMQVVQDFSSTPTFTWVPSTVEGAYQFNVVARDTTTTPAVLFAPVSVSFTLLPWITAPLAAGVVTRANSNPLVGLFSGPPCAAGHQLLVRFRPASPTGSQNPNPMTTNLVPCSTSSVNLYVGGMYPSSKYLLHWEEYSGTSLVNTGADVPFTTGSLPSGLHVPAFQVNVPATAHDAAYPVVLFETSPSIAADLAGNLLWYGPTTAVVRMEPNGTFYGFPGGSLTLFGLFDLAGNTVVQTNVEIVNEQLVAKGYPTMSEFNSHEGRNLPDGNIAVLAYRDAVSTSAQGGTPTKPVDIVASMVVVLDHNLQLVWAWDPFAHQDINRLATLGDSCAQNGGGCPTFNPSFTVANDWTHTNALQGTADGNIIISERSQDWVLKINYANGKGDGSVIWTMGAGGDFTIVNPPTNQTCNATTIPGNPNIIPWFTHQHDAHFDFEEDASGGGFKVFTVFDDGNTRNTECPAPQNSRGMVYLIEEAERKAYIETAADLGGYSFALGAAQLLTPGDGNIYASFDNGILPGNITQVSEVNLAGQTVYQMQAPGATYRAYRMQNLSTTSGFESNASTNTGGAGPVLPPDQTFDFSSGFLQDQETLQFNGNASLSGTALQLTSGGTDQAGSVFYTSPVDITAFTADFGFQLTNANADGFTFTIQNVGPAALGGDGSYLGYRNIGQSVAIKFDLFQSPGDPSNNSTGIFEDGALTDGGIDLTGSGINLHSGDKMDAHITYDGTTLNLIITDLVTHAQFSHPFVVNIPAIVGGNTAYVGFTGGTGGETAIQQILNWSYQFGQAPYYPAGLPSATGLSLNGTASLSGTALQLTNGGLNEAGSAFSTTPANIQSFTTDFKFQLTNPDADGFTFTIQNVGPTALGGAGGYLGYGFLGQSVAIKFDLYNNSGEGSDSTGIYVDGAIPTVPAIDLTGSGINLHSGDVMDANIIYDGATLTLNLTDLTTLATFSHGFVIDIPSTVGSDTAYVGFTGATGGLTSTQQILRWTFE